MHITLNDENRQVTDAAKINDLLESEGLADQLCAVAVNGIFVPKTEHSVTELKEGDQVEIVTPREGG